MSRRHRLLDCFCRPLAFLWSLRALARPAQVLAFFAVLAAGIPALVACDAQTAGKKAIFRAAAQSYVASGSIAKFTNLQGWTIQVEQAHFLVGPLVLFEGQARVDLWDLLRPWGIAYADPGHASNDTRRIVGENLQFVLIDLLQEEPTDLGLLQGFEGDVRSAEIKLLPASAAGNAPALQILEGSTFRAIGKATKNDVTEIFQIRVTVPDQGTMRTVDGLQADFPLRDQREKPGRVVLRLHLDQWFANLDPAQDRKTDPEGRKLWTEADFAILQALRSRFSYSVIWVAP